MIALPHYDLRDGMGDVAIAHWTPEGFLVEDENGRLFDYEAFKPMSRDEEMFRLINGMNRRRGPDGEYHLPAVKGGSISAAYSVVQGTVFAMTTAAKTMLNSIAPAGHGLALTEFGLSFDGVTAAAVPATIDLVSSTQGAAGTSGVTPTITQVRGRGTGGSAPTGGSNYTAEPTTLVNLKRWYVPQFMGQFVYQAPLGREVECDSSAGTIKALALRGNVSANVNELGYMEVEAVG